MRVLLADDKPTVRSALRLLLEQQPDLTVVAEAASADELTTRAGTALPDLVLLDSELPGLSTIGAPFGALSDLRSRHPDLLVVVLSAIPDVGPRALAAGADGFVSKLEPPEELLAELRATASLASESLDRGRFATSRSLMVA